MLFLAIFKLNFIKSVQYRGSILVKLIGTLISVLVEISLWTALFKANPIVKGTTFNDMINYMAITALLTLFAMAKSGDSLSHRITSGSIATDLIRPYDLKLYLVAQNIGSNLFTFLIFTLPIYISVLIVYGIKLPPSPIIIILFFISVLLGSIISFYYSYIMGMIPFWLQSSWYIGWVDSAMFTLFAGTFVPLWFYPNILIKISFFLPFRYITYEAVTFYLGKTSVTSMLNVFVMQIVWIVILIIFEALLWRKAQKKIMIYGG